jgi:hypothetical protein
MSWTPAVPPPPVAGAATGDGLGEGLGEPITAGDVAEVVTAVAGVVTGDVVVFAAAVLEPGPTAVTAPPGDAEVLPDAVAPPAAAQAVVAARTVRAPQPIATSLARPPGAR